jgi:HEAT repeat protein
VRQLRTGDTLARQDAADALGRLGPRAKDTIPDLVKALKDCWVAHPAAQALGRIGPKAVPALMKVLQDLGHDSRSEAGAALARMGAPAVPALVRALGHKEALVRQEAATALGAMGPRAAKAVPALVRVLLDDEPALEFESTERSLPGVGRVKVPLLRWSEDESGLFATPRWVAAQALGKIGPAATPALIAVVEAKERGISLRALATLGKMCVEVLPEHLPAGRKERVVGLLLLAVQLRFLVQEAGTPDRLARRLAVDALARQGTIARAAVPHLARAFRDEDRELCVHAAHALASIGPAARSAIPDLLEALKDRRVLGPIRNGLEVHTSVRLEAVRALLALGPAGRKALRERGVPLLIKGLDDPKADVRVQTVEALDEVGKEAAAALPALLHLLKSRPLPEETEGLVARALQSAGVSPGRLVPLLKHRAARVRREAATALLYLGRKARPAVPALVAALKDRDKLVQEYAARTLLGLREKVELILPILVRHYADGEDDFLPRVGPAARRAIPALQKMLEDKKDPFTRLRVARELVLLGASVERALAVLVEQLEDKNDKLSATASGVLCSLGSRVRPAVPALLQLLRHKNKETRLLAAKVLSTQGGKPGRAALAMLLGLLKDRRNSRTLRFSAAYALRPHGPAAAEAVPDLVVLIKEEAIDVRYLLPVLATLGRHARPMVPLLRVALRKSMDHVSVVECLEALGPHAAEVVPELMALLEVCDRQLRKAGAAALGAMEQGGRRAVPRLRALLDDDDPGVRAWAASALVRITGEHKRYLSLLVGMVGVTPEVGEALARLGQAGGPALPGLVAALKNPKLAVRQGAIGCLGKLGRLAARAVPALVRLLEVKDPDMRRRAAEALGDIGPAAKGAVARLKALVKADDEAADAAEEALQKIRRRPETP